MKTQLSAWKLPAFIGVLLIIALLINIFFYRKAIARREAKAQEQRQTAMAAEAKQAAEKLAKEKQAAEEARQQVTKANEEKRAHDEAEAKAREAQVQAHEEVLRKKAIDDAVAEHNGFLSRYLNTGSARAPGVINIAVVIESDRGTVNAAVANALAQRFASNSIQLLDSFFKPEFVADKFVDNIFSGDTSVFDRLQLTNSLNDILIGRQTVTYSTNTALDNTVSANLHLELMVLPIGAAHGSQAWSYSATGLGFNNTDARNQAEERLIHRISNDSTMSLTKLGTK